MKKTASILTIFAAILVLTACSALAASKSTTNASGTQIAPNGTPGAFNNRPLSDEEQLITGIFKLEGTDQAITAQQAADLLPLWQTMKVLGQSDTSSPEEIQAIVDQVKSTLTAAQTQAITDMKLTRQDEFAVMQAQGIVQQRGGFSGTPQAGRTPGAFSGGGFQGGPGGDPGGFPGGGAGFQGGGQNLTAEQRSTLQARITQGAGRANRTNSALLDALIKLLESKNK